MADYENVPPEIAAKMIADGECYVVDVRTLPEFLAHRIPGAHLLPVQGLNERHGEIPQAPDRKILIVCEHGVRSVGSCQAMAQHGWQNLVNMSGGMAQWLDAGLPVASGPGPDKENLRPPA